jgi:Tfp pilus assembly protein PilF
MDLYDKALSLDDSRAVVHHNRGMCLKAMGRRASAIASFQKALAIEATYSYSIGELNKLQMHRPESR